MSETSEINELHDEHFVAEDVAQTIWLRLRRMTSSRLCQRILTARFKSLKSEVIEAKAEGLAWAVRSALGYWESNLKTALGLLVICTRVKGFHDFIAKSLIQPFLFHKRNWNTQKG